MRLEQAGLRTLLVPTIRSTYYARSNFFEFLKHNWSNGRWAILPFRYSEAIPISAPHLVPMLCAAAVLVTAVVALLVPALGWLPVVVLAPYFVAAMVAAAAIAKRARDARLVLVLPAIFTALHLSHGLGSLYGALRTTGPLARHLWRTAST